MITCGCTNTQKRDRLTEKSESKYEDFSFFYSKFYYDTCFQSERILKPLKGTIRYWNNDTIIEESWTDKKITITSKENYLQVYENLKTDLLIKDTLVLEKYWIEQSGFIIEKKFILKSGKWYLYSYDISNI
jgi:hypothetical protein